MSIESVLSDISRHGLRVYSIHEYPGATNRWSVSVDRLGLAHGDRHFPGSDLEVCLRRALEAMLMSSEPEPKLKPVNKRRITDMDFL